jgi:hypothetical protein
MKIEIFNLPFFNIFGRDIFVGFYQSNLDDGVYVWKWFGNSVLVMCVFSWFRVVIIGYLTWVSLNPKAIFFPNFPVWWRLHSRWRARKIWLLGNFWFQVCSFNWFFSPKRKGVEEKLENFHELGSYYYNEKDPNRWEILGFETVPLASEIKFIPLSLVACTV